MAWPIHRTWQLIFLSRCVHRGYPDGLDSYFLAKSAHVSSCLLELRKILLEADPCITETRKYGMPCFLYGRRNLCFLWTEASSSFPYLLFVRGNLLHDPALEQGDRKKMKILKLDPNQDIPIELVKKVVSMAIVLERTIGAGSAR